MAIHPACASPWSQGEAGSFILPMQLVMHCGVTAVQDETIDHE